MIQDGKPQCVSPEDGPDKNFVTLGIRVFDRIEGGDQIIFKTGIPLVE